MSKAENTRAYIIEKTAVIFNKKGYAGTSLADLTEATGLTKGALYGNFKNKDEIALAAYDYNIRLVRAKFLSNVDAAKTCTERLLAIPEFYRAHYRIIAESGGCPILNTAVEADDNQPLLKKKVNQTISSWKKSLVSIITEGQEKGEFRTEVNPARYASIFLALFEGALMLSKATGDLSFINNSLDKMKEMVSQELKT